MIDYAPIDDEFGVEIRREIEQYIDSLSLIVRRRGDGWFQAYAAQMPTVVSSAATKQECWQQLHADLAYVLATMMAKDIPLPSTEELSAQINVRVTPQEKHEIALFAKEGHMTQSEFIREAIFRFLRSEEASTLEVAHSRA